MLGSEMAQRDERFLEYCIPRAEYLAAVESPREGLVILNAARGSGKSGLFLQLNEKLRRDKNFMIITKNSGRVEYPEGDLELSGYINFWKNQILGWIFQEIGNNSNFAFTDSEMNAVEYAEHSGSKSKNVLSAILDRLKFTSLPFEKSKSDPLIREEEIVRLLSNRRGNRFWVLLDELDDNYDNSTKSNRLLAGLLLAAQSLSEHISNLRIRVTIRPHILKLLETSFDKIPTLNENKVSISWTARELGTVLAKRIESFLIRNNRLQTRFDFGLSSYPDYSTEPVEWLIGNYFSNFDLGDNSDKTDGSRHRVYQTLATISMYRPRWLIEYCRLCLEQCKGDGPVTFSDAKKAWFIFGKSRISFLEAEHKSIYENVASIINRFSVHGKIALGSSIELRKFIIDNIIKTDLVKNTNLDFDKSSLDVARFLYMIDFIQAKEVFENGGYKFHYFTDRSELLSNWIDNKKLTWEIHPSFANALDLDNNRVYRAGNDLKISKPTLPIKNGNNKNQGYNIQAAKKGRHKR